MTFGIGGMEKTKLTHICHFSVTFGFTGNGSVFEFLNGVP